MPNSYFQFKQFRIDQQVAGMKVTTDGCLFGALIEPIQSGNILDIGTGTGLLALMIAQRINVAIDAIEIQKEVAQQATDNILASPWTNQIEVIHKSLQEFTPQKKYKQIVCNPPFFKNSFKGDSEQKNTAIHDHLLPMEILLSKSLALLESDGNIWVMYPEYEAGLFETMANDNDLYLIKKTNIHNTQNAPVFRVISSFGKTPVKSPLHNSIVIKKANNEYTEAFIHLLKDYYLHL